MPDTPEGIDLERLTPWFRTAVPGCDGDTELSASLIAGGRSNLTYDVSDGTSHWVLRRPPLGHVLATAHDMGREFRVISALRHAPVPVPEAVALCEDPAVNDAPFYVMERVVGQIPKTVDEVRAFPPPVARGIGESLVDVLAQLHAVDYEAVGLGDFGRPDGFLARNVARWGKQWEASRTRPLPAIDELGRRLAVALPESGPPAIVHGDYRLDNTMLDAQDPTRVVAVLDWEMSTLGDPLTDLGLLLLYWGNRDQDFVAPSAGIDPDRGWLTHEEIVDRYARQSGRDVHELDFYVVFAHYKLAIIVEGINARFRMGKTLGEGFDRMGPLVDKLAGHALELADASHLAGLRG